MNVEPPKFARSLPLGVRNTGNGTYSVQSRTRHWARFNVDVSLLQCDCESATKGQARQAAKQNGGCPPYEKMCPHLKLALAYDSIVLRAAMERSKK